MFSSPSSSFLETPTLYSAALSRHTEREIYLKLENLQPSGSFKNRGIGHLVETHVAQGAHCFVSASGGNAGIATAYAGRLAGAQVIVVVPESTTEVAKQRIRDEGAEVYVHGEDFDESAGLAREMAEEGRCVFVSPYNDPLIWEGHTSLVNELEKPDAILVSVGGGGLMIGIILGLQRRGWGDVPIISAETEGADCFAKALAAGHPVTLDHITSLATSIGAKQVAQKAFDLTAEHEVLSETVTDAQAVSAILNFADDERMLVEPACGAALAVLYEKREVLARFPRITTIVCGGKGVSLELLEKWKSQCALSS